MKIALASLVIVAANFSFFTTIVQATSPFVHRPTPSFPHSPTTPLYYRASTVYGDALVGRAAVIGARGNYEVMVAQSRILEEHRRQLALQNHLDKTFVALERKRMLAEHSDDVRLRRLERHADAVEILHDRQQDLAQKYRLTRHEVDPATGSVFWPASIAGPRYADHRQEIEQLMNHMVRYGYMTNHNYRDQLTQACNTFRQQLQEELRTEPADPFLREEYARADRFLKGVRYMPVVLESGRVEMLSMN